MKNKGLIVTLLVLVIVAFIAISGYVSVHNRLVALNENVKSSWAQVENQLQRRADLIPNLVATVKGYAAHEEEVLTEVTRARASVGNAGSAEQQIQANQQLTSALARLMVVVERYPDLKANQNFMALQDELAGTENRISVERRRYNEIVREFNSIILKIPYSLFAAGYKPYPYFEAAQGAKETPKVEF